MLIQKLFQWLFDFLDKLTLLLPKIPQLEFFTNYNFNEFITILQKGLEILAYFLPCNVVLAIIGCELAINRYKIAQAVYYNRKHTLPFI